MKVSGRSGVPPFAVMQVLAAANARRTAGHSVVSLCAGQPAGGAAPVVRARAAEILLGGDDLGYTEALGLPALRQAVAGHYERWYGATVDPARVAVTTGSSGAFLLAFLAAFDPGDRVAVTRPGYPAYRNILTALGCEVVELACGADTRYQPTVGQLAAAYYDGGLDGLVVASPANPTGTMIGARQLDALAEWCGDYDVRLVSDEIYHGLTYGPGRSAGVPGLEEATAARYVDRGAVVISSFSKYWAMTGWRLGWALLPAELTDPVDALAGNLALCPPVLSQHAALAALTPEGYASAEAALRRYAESRALLLARLPELGWSRIAPADGAFYLYADISAAGLDSVTWCRRLLSEAGVAVTPGTDFDGVDGHAWVRLSFAAPPDVVGEAVDRIVAWQRTVGRRAG